MKKIKTIILIIIMGICLILPIKVYGRAHTSVHSSTHSTTVHSSTPKSSTSSSHSVKSSTPSSKSKSSTSTSTQSSKSTKSTSTSTQSSKSTKSTSTGKTYTTTKSDSGRTTIKHETVKPKESTTIVNNNPTYYTNYSTQPSYSLSNSIFNYYMISEIFKDKDKEKDKISEQEIVKALEEKGYTEEEIKQILDEAKTEEKENKPFYDGWKWYNWTLFIICILILIGILITPIIMEMI